MAVIQGLEQFEQQLKRMTLAVQRKVLTQAVRSGAEIIRERIEEKAPRLTGHLSQRIITSNIASSSNAYSVLFRIGPARDAFYGVFDEFGTAHQTAEPFVLPGYEETKDKAEQEVRRSFIEAIEENL